MNPNPSYMKFLLSFIALLLFETSLSAQISPQTPWTWMKGDNTIDQNGNYGTQGLADIANKPGARNYSATWRDTAGKLWLFGGSGYGATTTGYLNDLWKFDPLSNKWIWIKGDNTTGSFSVYGTLGIPNPINKPGGCYSGVSWTGNDGNLWLFGGFGYTNTSIGFLNSLWKYNPTTNQWTWVKGDNIVNQAGNYGTKGIENSGNKPGARYGSRTWTDTNGNLWLFGGYGFDGSTTGILNDIWKYNPSTNSWTWMKGDNTISQVGIYGTKGIASADNKPGARYFSTSWKDENDNLWLFGGYGHDENSIGDLNDLWKYNPSTNEWTWISGDKILDHAGVYGAQGVPAISNNPGGRYVSSSWRDVSGELWLFGGYGYDAANNPGYLNDLWKYNPTTNKWTWVKGDSTIDQLSIYGIQGMADTSNKSGARTGSVSWTDGNGNLWLFGGYGFDGNTEGVLNDLWKISSYQIPLPLHLLQFNGVLKDEAVQLKWVSEQETDFSHYVIQRSFDGTNYISLGNVNGAGNNNRNEYSYYDNDIKNNSGQKIYYRLQLMDRSGSYTFSKILLFSRDQSSLAVSLFPNPAQHTLNISFDQKKGFETTVVITDMKGLLLKKQSGNYSSGITSINIDVSELPAGTYILSVSNNNGTAHQKFIKQ